MKTRVEEMIISKITVPCCFNKLSALLTTPPVVWQAIMEDGKQGVSWSCLCPDGCDTDLRRNLQEGQINDIPTYSNPNKLLLRFVPNFHASNPNTQQ